MITYVWGWVVGWPSADYIVHRKGDIPAGREPIRSTADPSHQMAVSVQSRENERLPLSLLV